MSVKPGVIAKLLSIFEIPRQAALAHIKVDRGDFETTLQEGDDDVHRGGRLARATLLVSKDNHVGHGFSVLKTRPERISKDVME